MPYINQYEYLVFLTDNFTFSSSLTLSNYGIIISLFCLVVYFVTILYFCKTAKPLEETTTDLKMQKILKDYKREVIELHQQNLNSFYSLATEPNFHQIKNMESFLITTEKQESNDFKTLPFFDKKEEKKEDTENLTSKENEIEMSKLKEINSALPPPPTFSDRFEVADDIQKNKEITALRNDQNDKIVNLDLSGNSGIFGFNTLSKPSKNQKKSGPKSKRKSRHTVLSKFKQIIITSSPIYSLKKESKLFPRHLRMTLLYSQILMCIFITSLNIIYLNNQRKMNYFSLIWDAGRACLLGWLIFLGLTTFSSTDKEKMISSKNDEEFYQALKIYEKDFRIKVKKNIKSNLLSLKGRHCISIRSFNRLCMLSSVYFICNYSRE